MVCSILSGEKGDVSASVDLLRALVNLVIFPQTGEIIPGSGAAVVVEAEVALGSAVAGLVAGPLLVLLGPGETMAGGRARSVRGPGAGSRNVPGASAGKVSRAPEAEPGVPETGEPSEGLMRAAASENPIYAVPNRINMRAGDVYIITRDGLMFSSSSPCKPQQRSLSDLSLDGRVLHHRCPRRRTLLCAAL